jgi:predicted dehydrogenase
VLKDYPSAGAKLIDYVLREGIGATLEKTRAKLDQKRVATDLALSAVGVVAASPEGTALAPGDTVACGGFLLPVQADAYLIHPDQCRKLARDADGIEGYFWLGALIELASLLRSSGVRSVEGIGLGALAGPFARWLTDAGLATTSGTSDAVVVGAAGWDPSLPGRISRGCVLDPLGSVSGVPDGWTVATIPDPGSFRSSPLDPRPLEWPFPFGPAGRDAAIDVFQRAGGTAPPSAGPSPHPLRIDLPTTADPGAWGLSIVGCGNFARAVLLYHALRVPGVRLRGICDIRPEVAAVHAVALGAAFHTADFEEILADEQTQAIFVASDHGSHAEHVALALAAGKAVHVEKPPAVSPEQLTVILDALDRTGGCLTIGYNRPFAHAYPLIVDAIAREHGPLSISMIVKGFKLRPEHWYYWPGQGTRLAGNLVHWIDLGYRLAGDVRPVAVHTMRDRSRHPSSVADNAVIAIRFDDGSVASISFTSAGDDLRGVREWIEIGRGATSVRIDDFDKLEIVRGPSRISKRFGRDRGHEAEIRHVVLKLKRRERDPAALRDLITTSAILFAAQRSFESGSEEAVLILDRWRALAS